MRRKRVFSFLLLFFFFSALFLNLGPYLKLNHNQVSLGVHGSEEDAARAYDRALIMEKGGGRGGERGRGGNGAQVSENGEEEKKTDPKKQKTKKRSLLFRPVGQDKLPDRRLRRRGRRCDRCGSCRRSSCCRRCCSCSRFRCRCRCLFPSRRGRQHQKRSDDGNGSDSERGHAPRPGPSSDGHGRPARRCADEAEVEKGRKNIEH